MAIQFTYASQGRMSPFYILLPNFDTAKGTIRRSRLSMSYKTQSLIFLYKITPRAINEKKFVT